jgi:phospholipase/carboxylesterase
MTHSLENVIELPNFALAHRVRSSQVQASGKTPCLILLHGVGANEVGLIELAKRQDPRLVVVLARAPLSFGPSQFGWFQVAFTAQGPAINADQAESARQRLLSFISQLPDAYGVDAKRIWIAGFSQGGIMSASVALTEPAKVAGFGIFSGRILPEIQPLLGPALALKQVHAFISHGQEDQKLGIHFARSARNLVQSAGISLRYNEYAAGHELNAAMQSDFERWMAEQLSYSN